MINLFSIFDEIENELMQSLENGIEEIEKNLQWKTQGNVNFYWHDVK